MGRTKATKQEETKILTAEELQEGVEKLVEQKNKQKPLSLVVALFDNNEDRAYVVDLTQDVIANILGMLGDTPKVQPNMVLIPASLKPISIIGD